MIEQLMTRAIATSSDRPAWLRARAGGVTATEVRDLRAEQTTVRALIEKKRTGDFEDLSHVRHIAHGNNREPVIAAWIAQRFNIQPNDYVISALANTRHLATPDGIGLNFDEELLISEIKTSKYNLDPNDSSSHFGKTGYFYQIQFQLYVTGARRCLFVWEQHDDDWSGWPGRAPAPVQAEPGFVWIDRDEREIGRLITLADRFLWAYDSEHATQAEDSELANLAERYIRTLRAESSFSQAKREIWDALHRHLHNAGADTYRPSPLVRVTWAPGRSDVRLVADEAAAIAADPGLFALMQDSRAAWDEHLAKFTREEVFEKKPQLKITEVKEEK
jgi:hypothetical protein